MDLIGGLIQSQKAAFIKKDEIEIRILSPKTAEYMTFAIRKNGKKSFNGKSVEAFEMKPSGFLMSMMAKALNFTPEIYLDLNYQMIGFKGPLLSAPGTDPRESDQRVMGITEWLY